MEIGGSGNLVFAVNGERFEVSGVDPATTVLEFLRYRTRFKSVKLGCGEGGCGACVILLSKYNPQLNQVEDVTVSSCLTLLCSINNCSITTSEGLGNSNIGFHQIHLRFANFHASQCGFCTPGICISLFSALENAKKTIPPRHHPGVSSLTVSEAEKAVAGHLCRCTGYRPIVDACKSFAGNVDIEDLGFKSFRRRDDWKEMHTSCMTSFSSFPEFLTKENISKAVLDYDRFRWYAPVSVEELQALTGADQFNSGCRNKILVGNTSTGYYKEFGTYYDKYIDLRFIPELSSIRRDRAGIEIGATVTISSAIEALRDEKENECFAQSCVMFKKIADHMEKIATDFVRNSGSVGGNLVMASRSFPSDIATILLGAGATVNLLTGTKNEILTMEKFLEKPIHNPDNVLLSVTIPHWNLVTNFSTDTSTKLLYETYRAAPRPLGNALPYLNAAFLAEVSFPENSDAVVVNSCRLAFGAYGTKHAIRATIVEEYLARKVMSTNVLYEAVELVRKIVVPEDNTSSPAYRSSLAGCYLLQFFGSLIPSIRRLDEYGMFGAISEDEKRNEVVDYSEVPTLLLSSKQKIELPAEHRPVGLPIVKSGAALQASGEAIFVDDIPSPPECLYGAFIYSTKPLARIKRIHFPNMTLPDRVRAIISAKDIPENGTNIGSRTNLGSEPLFADDITQCAGQFIAFVVADTQKNANVAAHLCVVDYETDGLDPPILSVKEAVERSSFFEIPPSLSPKPVGDFAKGMSEADHKIVDAEIKLESQYYFYMETQTALAVPDEDNCVVINSSSQCPEYAHATIARCLGVPEHNIRVITRRVGGGFGGKAIKSMPVATACALAAHKLGRPVRVYVDRQTDMIMAGGRHPMEITYNVGFKSNGKITALHLDILVDAGIFPDISPIIPHNILSTLRKYDWGALSFNIKVCKTNRPSRSSMRAPGELQGSYVADAVIEQVAETLSINADHVKKVNLHTYNSLRTFYDASSGEPLEYTLPSIWENLADSSDFNRRCDIVNEFNLRNKFKKRGISRIPAIYKVEMRATPGKVSILSDGSIVVEVGGIEIGQGLWTKVKQMVAYALGVLGYDGNIELLEKVRLVQADTLSVVQGGITAGSTTSEASCEAVRLCCNVLVERLKSLKARLQEQASSVGWDALIEQAYLEFVNLSASTLYVPDESSTQYLNYGAAVSEVEVNLLTGETTLLRTYIIYDCEQSLNPAVDLGQVEGAFVQGIGFFMLEEYQTNEEGLVISKGTWTYKVPTIDTIPKQFNVEILNSGHHQKRVLSSKASGEPPLVLAASVHCAIREAAKAAREQLRSWSTGQDGLGSTFELAVPATLPAVKEACGLDIVERYLKWTMDANSTQFKRSRTK